MKKLLTLFLGLFLLIQTNKAGTIYWAIGGNDGSGTGTSGNPYATLHRAVAGAVSGDICHGLPGTYTEAGQIVVPIGVNIEGEGVSTHVIVSFFSASYHSAALFLSSTKEGTIGNQFIRNIWIDGNNWTSYVGILVHCRSFVSVHDCKFTNFQASNTIFDGKNGESSTSPPATYSTGNEYYNNLSYDCNDRALLAGAGGTFGNLSLSGQQSMLIHDNTFDNRSKSTTHNGDLIGAVVGFNKDMKIYNNTMLKPRDDGNEFNCGFETWYDQGGTEWYNNNYTGGGDAIDIGFGGANKGTYGYSWYIHDNLFQLSAQPDSFPTYPKAIGSMGVQFETQLNPNAGDAIIVNNHFKNLGTAVQMVEDAHAGDAIRRVYIHNNLCENMGYANNNYGGVFYFTISTGTTLDSIFLDNNTITTGSPGSTRAALFLEHSGGVMSNIYFRNTIVKGITSSGYGYITFRGSVAVDHLFSQSNSLYLNTNSNNPFYFAGAPTATNFTNTGNLTSNPLLDASFHLQTGSPAIGSGIEAGYGLDRGAFPYAGIVIPLPPNKMIHINHNNIPHH